MANETYNGWTNKATWLVKLWIDNTQWTQEYWIEVARNSDEYGVESMLREYFDEACLEEIPASSLQADLMSWALAFVNWGEIAHALIEDAEEVPV